MFNTGVLTSWLIQMQRLWSLLSKSTVFVTPWAQLVIRLVFFCESLQETTGERKCKAGYRYYCKKGMDRAGRIRFTCLSLPVSLCGYHLKPPRLLETTNWLTFCKFELDKLQFLETTTDFKCHTHAIIDQLLFRPLDLFCTSAGFFSL